MLFEEFLPERPTFEFRHRPGILPGDLRISWRLALLILILSHSRGRKASLAKLHLLNDALRSETATKKLTEILSESRDSLDWRIRVEPALGRALDIARGEGLLSVGKGPVYRLTKMGVIAAAALEKKENLLIMERAFLATYSRQVSERFVTDLVRLRASS